MSDPRDRRAILYRLPLLLAQAVLAVTAGAKTFIVVLDRIWVPRPGRGRPRRRPNRALDDKAHGSGRVQG
ncbi:hypothetical protein [Saccharopolyspora sp. ASAGF58]|uniref:hypothetical protein n=1 Tax=Saccharopolyspora sp. ASAGF58 TaxID=2719023 RepID=UPI001B301306|nr:hypothetical protein [Saccharopolyspora sp. ASAGF58]